ncbi:hypothetical protein [Desulfolucanica intricata]|uniref:hypothetical protein n=1 Tax=Desulfolucanica intricata TaxID=1285191 RepID=UPI00082E9797|nr:hypothetical protein [Desulfolucanica intricata]
MPSKESIKLILSKDTKELQKVRFPGLNKPFEELTISELVNFRNPGSVQDTYEVDAFTDNVSITTSSIISKIGREKADEIMKQEYQKIKTLKELDAKTRLNTKIGRKKIDILKPK